MSASTTQTPGPLDTTSTVNSLQALVITANNNGQVIGEAISNAVGTLVTTVPTIAALRALNT